MKTAFRAACTTLLLCLSLSPAYSASDRDKLENGG